MSIVGLSDSNGRAMSKQMMRDAFAVAHQARAKKAEKNGDADLAQEIEAFWFYNLRAKAAHDVADERGEVAASKPLDHASVQTTKRHYLRRRSKVSATK